MQSSVPAASSSVLPVLDTRMWLVLLYTTELVSYLSPLWKFVRAARVFFLYAVAYGRVSYLFVQVTEILFEEESFG